MIETGEKVVVVTGVECACLEEMWQVLLETTMLVMD